MSHTASSPTKIDGLSDTPKLVKNLIALAHLNLRFALGLFPVTAGQPAQALPAMLRAQKLHGDHLHQNM